MYDFEFVLKCCTLLVLLGEVGITCPILYMQASYTECNKHSYIIVDLLNNFNTINIDVRVGRSWALIISLPLLTDCANSQQSLVDCADSLSLPTDCADNLPALADSANSLLPPADCPSTVHSHWWAVLTFHR